MIVELFGPSGTGKSYFAARLAEEHKLKSIRLRFGQKHILAAWFAFRNFAFFRRLLSLWDEETKQHPVLRGNKLYRLISFMAKEQKARLRGGGVIDEGIVQYFLILFERQPPLGEITECLRLLPTHDYLICIVESDLETRFRRMRERGKVSRWELGEQYTEHWHKQSGINAALLKPVLLSLFRCEVVRNDS